MNFIANELVEQCIAQFDENTRRIHICCAPLTEEDIWKRPNNSSNSIGNLILHLCGNVSQYVLASLGRKPDTRNRDEEFEAVGGISKAELLVKLSKTMEAATQVMRTVSQAELERKRSVQGFEQTGVHILIHVTEHYSYHTGQIAFWVKELKNMDLGFYAGIDLSVKNED
jgi:uncharacterized damage-inducible protein DinB